MREEPQLSCSINADSRGISSQIRTKLRDWAVWQARAGRYSQAALSSNDSKTLYTFILTVVTYRYQGDANSIYFGAMKARSHHDYVSNDIGIGWKFRKLRVAQKNDCLDRHN